jgi:hypothetical protein
MPPSSPCHRPALRRRAAPRAVAVVVGGGVAIAASVVLVACILADPPAALPDPVTGRPTIIRASVTPPATTILREWPRDGTFMVPIELAQNTTFQWHAFFDYDAINRTPVLSETVSADPASLEGGIFTLAIGFPTLPVSAGRCHTFEVIVAKGFDQDHSPSPPGGDSVSWFYSPTGDLTGCAIFDAGGDGAAPADDSGSFHPKSDASD